MGSKYFTYPSVLALRSKPVSNGGFTSRVILDRKGLIQKRKLNFCPQILFWTSIPQFNLVKTSLSDLDIPRNVILFFFPIKEITAIGKLIGSFNFSNGHSIPGRNLSPRDIRVSNYKWSLICSQFNQTSSLYLFTSWLSFLKTLGNFLLTSVR